MTFDPRTALAYARAIARPRLVGSGEEEKVAQEIAARLENFGWRVEREPFRFTRAFDIALAAELALAIFLILLSSITRSGHFSFIIGLSLLALLSIAQPLNRIIHCHAVAPDSDSGGAASALQTLCLKLGRLYRASNIIAIPSPVREAGGGGLGWGSMPHLYLVSHLDSKSQPLPIAVRLALFAIALPSIFVFALTTFLPSPSPLDSLSIIAALLTLLSAIPLLFLNVGNDSPGAIDNASGTGVVLHLAECLAARPDLIGKLHLTVLITSAEEMATMGALHHVLTHEPELRRASQSGGLHILNFDGTGVDGKLFVAASPSPFGRGVRGEGESLTALLHRASTDLGIPLHRFGLPGVLFDHIPFAEHGFDSASLMTIGRAAWGVHTAHDTPDKLHPRGFEMAGRAAMRVIELLAL